jgi:Zn-dependent protease
MAEALRAPRTCPACGTELAEVLLACPACRRLVHADELKRLAAAAAGAEARGDGPGALAAWREALALLPAGTRQHEAVSAEVARWSAAVPASAERPRDPPGWLKRLGPLAVIAFAAWKLVGFAKVASVLSLFAAFAVYWQMWGWRFAAGFLGSIYLHELGHVVALRRAGIPASAPMFIPGVGAFVRMRRAPPDARTDAQVGLAGPVAGAAVAVALAALARLTGSELLLAVAHAGAVVNLFNLMPIWSLDGARGFNALTRTQRFGIVVVTGAALYATHEGMLWLVLIVAALRMLSPRAARRADHGVFAAFAGLVVVLSIVATYAR